MTAKTTATIMERVLTRFNYGNTEWADSWCPWIRTAATLIEHDDKTFEQLWQDFVKDGCPSEMLDGLSDLTLHFLEIAEMGQAVLERSRTTLQRLGYSADNPRADQRRN